MSRFLLPPRRPKRRSALALGIVVAIATMAAPAGLAHGAGLDAPFSSIDLNCTTSSSKSAAPLTTARPDTQARITVASGGGRWWVGKNNNNYISGGAFGTGDVVWAPAPAFAVNDAPSAELEGCSGSAARIDFFETPTPPVNYTGGAQHPSSAQDKLFFNVPSAARFVADLGVQQGAISVGCSGWNNHGNGYYIGCPRQTFASSGLYVLGGLEEGSAAVDVDALDGPQARYSVNIRPLPVAISDLGFGQAVARPGAALTASYSLDGDTQITAVVRNSAGTVVRVLAQDLSVGRGSRSLTWDGRDSGGAALPDGPYSLQLTSRDPYGNSSQAATDITMDGTGPSANASFPAGPQDALTATVSDSVSGIGTGGVAVDVNGDGAFDDYEDSWSSFQGSPTATATISAPYDGWARDTTYQVLLRATDGVGNPTEARWSFRIPSTSALESGAAPPFAAKLEVARARVLRSDRRLDVLAPITARASGEVRVDFRAASRTESFTVPVDSENRRVRFNRAIPRAQANLGTGILTLSYPGDADTQPQEVRLRAASQKANLDANRPRIEDGRLKASGTITTRARGVVRVQVLYEPPGQPTVTLEFNTPIKDGRYSLNKELSADQLNGLANRRGVVHSYTLFTGYFERRIRGEMQSYQVLGDR